MKEATYDEATDTWKRPWWANTQDDGNMPYRQLPFSLSLGLDWSTFLFGVKWESHEERHTCTNWPDYKQTWVTLNIGPLWIMHERFKDIL